MACESKEGSRLDREATALRNICEGRIRVLEALGMVGKADEFTEQLKNPDLRAVGGAVHYLNKIILYVGQKGKLEKILAVLAEERPKWGGPSQLGDEAVLLRQACEERIPKLSTIPELFQQLGDRHFRTNELAFMELRSRVQKTDEANILQSISDGLKVTKPGSFHCDGWGELTEANFRALIELCAQKLSLAKRYDGPDGIRPPASNGGQAPQTQKVGQKA